MTVIMITIIIVSYYGDPILLTRNIIIATI